MTAAGELRNLSQAQRHTFVASFLGWTFGAFDFFGLIAITYNIGGTAFGALSQRFGRRRMIVLAALLVQGAWGVVPVHLNELSPEDVRGTLPGFVYQLGNLFAAGNATIQADIAEHFGGDYAVGLALVAGVTAVVIALVAGTGREAKDVAFGAVPEVPQAR